MTHPCETCLTNEPTKYHQCDKACYNYRLYISSVTGESVAKQAAESVDLIRRNQRELDGDDLA